ncbi:MULTISPECIES: poly-beta-1,6-N-acetyl-D-glucosamine biosynthesis protein PgaD [Comamonas]|jgi:biofilm PGA synthesis protein PgaD|uniref:poly-beta-1,6-N-acetyl-D-glucosamine biosynthesis protein PgaD n=1 Tax=Comamonas TaxID=283 RepID=UPI001C476CA6|nr:MULTISPECIES: poly-beta-1,6-N-acetyl-D-glucosamine biosynthesis protein PgaD [Comamonas]MBV7420009.1 poly-beta-1,6-N-acetyl-D-glucosamine biosynthesis protein PgaD [Comamonas sp. CMM03]MDH0050752.1 poly-beta-1,6-N-acetyl-D-glucosamine biosynthesis protein PgaD [Comamonas terrigena]MDH0509820.1 poly-beta-1,6-N-acetyl-D-glucosamine biosynthesis protein PgaD [Comamonas terrigena]MDH1089801.1 poly-beta-1,6-N-acetyl-D-glucosamine biosynthesis protein PgaD [Comamonas terrigena]MDH1501670.1 poly-b
MMATPTTPAANHLPLEIDASTMVIRSQRSAFRHAVDWIVTLLAWCAFLYLLVRGIMAVGSNQMQGVDMPFFSRVMPSVDTLIIYALAMVLQGLFLLVWALYNWSRFHGKTRRSSASALDDARLTRSYGIDQAALDSLRSQPVSVIHHAPDGSITAIAQERAAPRSRTEPPSLRQA